MNKEAKMKFNVAGAATVLAVTAFVGYAAITGCDKHNCSSKNSEANIVTNENGSVSRSFTECTVTTNGNLVTEHRRETRTTLDTDGNMLATTTSEYAQSYPVGTEGMTSLAQTSGTSSETAAAHANSFLGLTFGSVFAATNFVSDAGEPTLLRATFTPKKGLQGFDDYYVYVTPKTHKVVKVYACARQAVEPGAHWRRHYLIEALEKRYHTWARPRSWCQPIYSFDIGEGRFVTAYLAGATRDYETIVMAWDDALLTTAADEREALREAEQKAAAQRRTRRVDEAAESF